MTTDVSLKRVEMIICQACLDGVGQECHTPGCAMFLHRIDLPFPKDVYVEVTAASGGDAQGAKHE